MNIAYIFMNQLSTYFRFQAVLHFVFYFNVFPHSRVFTLTKILIAPLSNMDNLQIRNSDSFVILLEPSYQHKCVIIFSIKIILLGEKKKLLTTINCPDFILIVGNIIGMSLGSQFINKCKIFHWRSVIIDKSLSLQLGPPAQTDKLP